MLHLFLALVVLCVIVATSLFIDDLKRKVVIFLGLGGATVGGLLAFGGEHAEHVLHHVFVVDYPQFIFIPVATVLIACLGLFTVKVKEGASVAWFMLIGLPVIGNFATTWAIVPIGLALVPILQERYGDRWFRILIANCIFSMNMLALATLLADPPQALWAVKAALKGEPLGLFFPLAKFWPYLVVTWGVYYVTLRRFGVSFGNVKELLHIKPSNWWLAGYGLGIVVCIGIAVTMLKGYQITAFLGIVCLLAALSSILFGKHARHKTVHWVTETMTIFVAFFSVVALAHTGLHYVHVSNQGMVPIVIGLTLGADNAAAFAAAYNHFESLSENHMAWFNCHPSVTYGGISPLGNGPQIALFLIVLVSLKIVTAKEVFVTWFKEAAVFGPYLLVWTLGITSLIEFGFEPTIAVQFFIGLIAATVCFQFMDIQRLFSAHVDDEN